MEDREITKREFILNNIDFSYEYTYDELNRLCSELGFERYYFHLCLDRFINTLMKPIYNLCEKILNYLIKEP